MTDLLLFTCFSCGLTASACPNCVVTVHVDPETNMPVDVAVVDGRPVNVEPTEEVMARSLKEPICDTCVQERNARRPEAARWPTSEETHRRHV